MLVPSGDLVGNGAMLRDDNDQPVQGFGLQVSNSKTFTTTGTVAVPVFKVTGQALVLALWGIVKTTLGNQTAVYFRLNDQTAQTAITLATGTTATGSPVNTIIEKNNLATAAVDVDSAATGLFEEIATANLPYYQQFRVGEKTGSVETDIEYVYTTSDNPTSGAITFYIQYYPLGQGSKITAI